MPVNNANCRQRIAEGCDVTISEINNLLRHFDEMQLMMRKKDWMQKMLARMGGDMLFAW